MKLDLNFFSNAISEVKILKKRRKQTSGEAWRWTSRIGSAGFLKGGDFFEPQFFYIHLQVFVDDRLQPFYPNFFQI